jgi:predicted TIM-barrel fold metal-dependent hydrolase
MREPWERMMRKIVPALIGVALAAMTGAALAQGAPRNVAYIDAHSHLFAAMPGDEEIAAFRKAGVAGVVLMWPDPVPLAEQGKKNPGYVFPWLSLSAQNGSVVTDKTASEFIDSRDKLGFCGFGELATRLAPPNPQVSDAAFISDPRRVKIYAAAEAKSTPVNMHVVMTDPVTQAAVEKILTDHPHVTFIVAHGGGGLAPDALTKLLGAHANLNFDLSGPLAPPRPEAPRPQGAIAADGNFKPEWRTLFERYPDRFVFAMDTQSVESVAAMPGKIAAARKAFAPLPLAVEEAIANGNIKRILKPCAQGPR